MNNIFNPIFGMSPNEVIKEKRAKSGETFLVAEKTGKWLDENTFMNPDGSLSVTDPNMVIREFYNGGSEDVIFKKQFPHLMGHNEIIVKPDQFEMIPHAYYVAFTKSGRDIIGKWFFGNDMFKHERSKIR